jgi:hypothetical protein
MAAGYEVCDDGVGNRITQLPFGIEKLVGRLGDRTQISTTRSRSSGPLLDRMRATLRQGR